MILNVSKVEICQKFLESLISSLNFDKEFLGMRSGLSASTSTHVLLDSAPLLSEEFEGFKEPKMLVFRPASLLQTIAVWVVMLLTIQSIQRSRPSQSIQLVWDKRSFNLLWMRDSLTMIN